MKTNRREFIKKMNWGLAGIAGLLGFGGCDKIGRVEYGTPNADYTVKGKVVNKTNGKPVEGIQVKYDTETVVYKSLSTTTNVKGEFKLTGNFFPEKKKKLTVCVEDIDDEKNGSFQSESLQVDFSNAKHSGKTTHWYDGEYTVDLDVELTEKNAEI